MSLIHIARNNVVLGQFTEEEVRAGLASGTYQPTDLAWRVGNKDWLPLSRWPEFAAPGSTPPPIFQAENELPSIAMPSWERRAEIGKFSAFIRTTKEVFQSPDTTFAYMPKSGGFKGPLSYYLIPQAILALLFSILIALFFSVVMADIQAKSPNSANDEFFRMISGIGGGGIAAIYLIIFAIWIPCAIFIATGILHLLLKLWGAAKEPYEVTFRVSVYVAGAMSCLTLPLQILSAIPCIGMLFGLINLVLMVWGIIVLIKGLMVAHGASGGRVTGAVLTPVLLCCCLYALVFASIFASAMANAGGHRP